MNIYESVARITKTALVRKKVPTQWQQRCLTPLANKKLLDGPPPNSSWFAHRQRIYDDPANFDVLTHVSMRRVYAVAQYQAEIANSGHVRWRETHVDMLPTLDEHNYSPYSRLFYSPDDIRGVTWQHVGSLKDKHVHYAEAVAQLGQREADRLVGNGVVFGGEADEILNPRRQEIYTINVVVRPQEEN